MSFLLNLSPLCLPPQGRFLHPFQARVLLYFTSLISSHNSPGRGSDWAGMLRLPLMRKLKFRDARGLAPGGRARSGWIASCRSQLLLTFHIRGQSHAFLHSPLPMVPGGQLSPWFKGDLQSPGHGACYEPDRTVGGERRVNKQSFICITGAPQR